MAQSFHAHQGQPREHAGASAFFDLEAFAAAPLVREPFLFLVVPNFIRPALFGELAKGFPKTPGPGSFPPKALGLSAAFQNFLAQFESQAFQSAIESKFGIDLGDRPKLLTIRGEARRKDGTAHNDSKTKLITVLLYMNENWNAEGGRLRLLRSQNLDDAFCEIAPVSGTLVAFQRSDMSWHGHRPCSGQRQVVQLNWLTEKDVAAWERTRHWTAACFKTIARNFPR